SPTTHPPRKPKRSCTPSASTRTDTPQWHDSGQATDALGLKGGWMSYFGCRAAPLGAVGPELVAAVFYNFHPAMVARAILDAWTYATPAQLLVARLRAVHNAVQRLFSSGD
ncbi:hypothetical protein AB0B82_09775, partial [Kribbella sp. NPDC048915]